MVGVEERHKGDGPAAAWRGSRGYTMEDEGATAEGREVELPGMTISRFTAGRIAEDWTIYAASPGAMSSSTSSRSAGASR